MCSVKARNDHMAENTIPVAQPRTIGSLALILLLALAWGCYWPAMKVALGEVDVWLFRTLSGVGGGLTFLALLKAGGAPLAVPRAERMPLALTALLNMTLFPLCSLLALRFYGAGPAVIVAYTMPVWVALLGSFVLRERLSLRRLGALGSGLLGLAVLLLTEVRRTGGVLPAGALLVLLGAVFWAGGVVLQKRTAWTMPVSVLTGWQLVLGTVPFVPACFALSDFSVFGKLSTWALLAWAYSTFVGFVLGYYLFYQVIARLPVTIASITTLVVPVVGVLASGLLLGERVGAAELIALGAVVTAVALILFEHRE